MSLFSSLKKVVAKVNEHTADLKEADIDINELYDRVIALEDKGKEGEKELLPGESASSSDEEELKLEK